MTTVGLDQEKYEKVKLLPADDLWTTACDGAVRLRMEETGPASEPPITTIQMFQQTVQRCGNKPALGTKRDGRWETTSYIQYYQQCRTAAKSFLKLGLERFHGVAILGSNSAEWFLADVGAIMAGGLAVGIYATNSPDACKYIAENCKANILVVENHRQLTKILQGAQFRLHLALCILQGVECIVPSHDNLTIVCGSLLKVRDQLPHLKAIVQYREDLQEKEPNVYTWKDFLELGKDIPDSQLDDIIASLKPNQCCTLIYTSGTTGLPKGVMLSHDNTTWMVKVYGLRRGLTDNDVIVSYLPVSHAAAQLLDLWAPIGIGATTYFAQPDAMKGTLLSTLQEVRPTIFLGVPRIWEKIQEKMKLMEPTVSFMKSNESTPSGHTLAANFAIKSVREAVGLDRAVSCTTGAAPISKDMMQYFTRFNISLLDCYGMSECTSPHSLSINADFRVPSCGKTLPGCKTRIYQPDENGIGEICIWGRHVFMGYLNMEDKTREALDEEGWLHSGDLGKVDEDGFLYVTGRIKELIITAGGENIPPILIEDAVKAELPIISNAMLVGDQRKFLSMLLTLKCTVDADTGEPKDDLSSEAIQICQQLGSTATRVSEVTRSKDPAIYNAIQKGIERVNLKAISNAQKVQKWTILPKDFSIAGGELGPTSKLRRPVVVAMYEKVIDEFYKEAELQDAARPAQGASLALKPFLKSHI